MKLRSFLAVVALSALTFMACEQLEQQQEASITVTPTELSFDETGEPSQEIVLNSTRDWRLSGTAPEWIALSKSSGVAGEYHITVSLDPNNGNNRETELQFTIGLYSTTVKVTQQGKEGETVYEQITCKEFIEKADTVTVYRLKGKVSGFNSKYCSFNLTDETGTVVVYEVNNKAEWIDVIKNGGTATARGVYKQFVNNGTVKHEMVAAYVEEFVAGNDGTPKGTGTVSDPYNPAGIAKAVEALTWTSSTEYDVIGPVFVKGKVSAISEAFTTQYGNASFTLVDAEDGSGYFEAYRVLYVGNRKYTANDPQIKVGDVVVVYGKMMNYGNTTPETVSGAFVYELNGVNEGGVIEQGTPKGDGSLANPYNPSAITREVASLQWTNNTTYDATDPVYVKGVVSRIDEEFTTNFGNGTFNITDEDGKSNFVAYRVLYVGNRKYTANDPQIKVGDVVIVYGSVMNYKGETPESTSGSFLYELNGVSEGGVIEQGTPVGDGTLESPYNPSAVTKAVEKFKWVSNDSCDVTKPVYVKGKVSKIDEAFSKQYGNGTFNVTDLDGKSNFVAYRVLYLNNQKWTEADPQIQIGDEVIVYGKVMNYKGTTPETTSGAYLYSLNGSLGNVIEQGTPKGDGTLENPYNPSAATVAVSKLTWTSTFDYQTTEKKVYVKGKVHSISEQFGTQYGNASFSLVDEDGKSRFEAFRVLYLQGEKYAQGDTLKVGDEVVVYGKLMNYQGKTPETVTGAYMYSLNGYAGEQKPTGTPKGDGTVDNPYNPAGVNAAAARLTYTSSSNYQTLDNVYIKGKISSIESKGTYTEGGSYGNASFHITDVEDGQGEFYVFRALYLKNKKFETGQTDIKVGDVVVICGKVMNYNEETPETVAGQAYLYSLNGDQGQETPAGTPKGTGTAADPYNPAGAAAVVANFTWTSSTDYQKTENDVYVKGKISKIESKGTYTEGGTYGNASFHIVDVEDGTGDLYVFRALYLTNKKYEAGQPDIKVGDVVVICGKLMNYQGTTPETVAGEAYLASLNGQTEFSSVFGVEKTRISVAAGATSAVVKVVGNVPWTATSTATIEGGTASGTGAGEFSVSFPANTDTEQEKTYTVTVTTTADVETKEIVVTIIQGKKVAGGEASTIEFVIKDIAEANGWTNGTKYTTIEKDGVKLAATGGSNTGKYYTSGNEWRFYQTESPKLDITVSDDLQFVSVSFEYAVSNTGILVGSDGKTVPSGSESSCQTFSVGNSGTASNGQVKFTKIVVTVH